MKAAIKLNNGGALQLESLAGLVVMQTGAWGLRPITLTLEPGQVETLIDLLGMMGVLAEDQAHELDVEVALCELRARRHHAQELHEIHPPGGDAFAGDVAIPAFLTPGGLS